jgi:hypothetical protein
MVLETALQATLRRLLRGPVSTARLGDARDGIEAFLETVFETNS